MNTLLILAAAGLVAAAFWPELQGFVRQAAGSPAPASSSSGATGAAAPIRALADEIVSSYGFDVDPQMLVRIAWIESAFNPAAIGDDGRSIGLMQTLLSTAQWLATDMGYRSFGVPGEGSLRNAKVSMYFGAAYLDWLTTYRGTRRSEEWIVRAYNGGQGWQSTAAGPRLTAEYWARYQAARERWG